MSDTSNRQVAYVDPEAERKAAAAAAQRKAETGEDGAAGSDKPKPSRKRPVKSKEVPPVSASAQKNVPSVCPLCGGAVLRGKAAYGCANWRTGCTWRLPFE